LQRGVWPKGGATATAGGAIGAERHRATVLSGMIIRDKASRLCKVGFCAKA
jgi:hypothetical protein